MMHALAECIASNPASWQGVSLLYFRLDEKTRDLKSALQQMGIQACETQYCVGRDRDCILFGAEPTMLPASVPWHSSWIPDISVEPQKVCEIIRAMEPEAQSHVAVRSDASPISIMLVEDDRLNSEMAAYSLKQFATVFTTSNARQAIANYYVRKPDLVFLDIHYTNDVRDGFDVLSSMFNIDKDAFVIIVSGDHRPTTILKALQLGARGFISKPFRASDFTRYVNQFTEERATP